MQNKSSDKKFLGMSCVIMTGLCLLAAAMPSRADSQIVTPVNVIVDEQGVVTNHPIRENTICIVVLRESAAVCAPAENFIADALTP